MVSSKDAAKGQQAEKSLAAGEGRPPMVRKILTAPKFWGIAIPRFLAEPAWQTFNFWIPLYLATVRHMDLKQIAIFAWMPFLAGDLWRWELVWRYPECLTSAMMWAAFLDRRPNLNFSCVGCNLGFHAALQHPLVERRQIGERAVDVYGNHANSRSDSISVRLIPYFYDLIWQAHHDYAPIIRPTFHDFPEDERCYAENDDVMLGKNLLPGRRRGA